MLSVFHFTMLKTRIDVIMFSNKQLNNMNNKMIIMIDYH